MFEGPSLGDEANRFMLVWMGNAERIRGEMNDPYRHPADMVLVKVEPRGLVRANGSHCTCKPPGFLWCWWYKVQQNDKWFCEHGGSWRRAYVGNMLSDYEWKAILPTEFAE